MISHYLWQALPLSALVSASVTLAIRYYDRPRPAITLDGIPHIFSNGDYRMFVEENKMTDKILLGELLLSNHGDGIAYDVRVFGSYCDVAISADSLDGELSSIDHWTHRIPALKSGSAVKLMVGFAYNGKLDYDSYADWERQRATVIVAWTTTPGRGRHRQLRRRLRRIEVEYPHKPGLTRSRSFTSKEKEGVIPFYVRRVRSMERRSLRGAKHRRLYSNDLWRSRDWSYQKLTYWMDDRIKSVRLGLGRWWRDLP
ncbi:hypothetical protein [Mycobacteroides abscessus]|uniref:hypothetical protein n=2 Tax=Mycobacteroides abscessus TaxID=36809 RepID=UPI001057024F|nr:hypothetical protein [Mycobacteroides abscessus]MDO3107870.1 hypothetical protein [Mycobacteroides abscessus subsp. abscessus]